MYVVLCSVARNTFKYRCNTRPAPETTHSSCCSTPFRYSVSFHLYNTFYFPKRGSRNDLEGAINWSGNGLRAHNTTISIWLCFSFCEPRKGGIWSIATEWEVVPVAAAAAFVATCSVTFCVTLPCPARPFFRRHTVPALTGTGTVQKAERRTQNRWQIKFVYVFTAPGGLMLGWWWFVKVYQVCHVRSSKIASIVQTLKFDCKTEMIFFLISMTVSHLNRYVFLFCWSN